MDKGFSELVDAILGSSKLLLIKTEVALIAAMQADPKLRLAISGFNAAMAAATATHLTGDDVKAAIELVVLKIIGDGATQLDAPALEKIMQVAGHALVVGAISHAAGLAVATMATREPECGHKECTKSRGAMHIASMGERTNAAFEAALELQMPGDDETAGRGATKH